MKITDILICCFVFLLLVIGSIVFIKLLNKTNIWNTNENKKQLAAIILNSLLVIVGTIMFIGLQSRANARLEHENAVFDKKITVYHDFLNDFHNIIKDQTIDDNEIYSLQIKLSYLSLHINEPKHIQGISRAIAAIVVKIKNPYNEDKGIMIDLMEITDIMNEELYGNTLTIRKKLKDLYDLRDEMVLDFYGINVPSENITSYYYIVRRIRDIKKSMAKSMREMKRAQNKRNNVNLYDKQWVYNGYTLVHDLYTDWDKTTGTYVCNERSDKYAVDLVFTPKGDSIYLEIFSRKNTKEETAKLLDSLNNYINLPYPQDSIQENSHYIYQKWKANDVDDQSIAQAITNLLQAMNKCRKMN